MIYNLGEYRFKDFKIYKKEYYFLWLYYWKRVDKLLYGYYVAVRKINKAVTGIDEELDVTKLSALLVENFTKGKYLVHFRRNDNIFLNDPLPANITPHKGRLSVSWDNGSSCVIDAKEILIYELEE